MNTPIRVAMMLVLATLLLNSSLLAQHRQAPPGMFKDLTTSTFATSTPLIGR